jgi:hypothetical protein
MEAAIKLARQVRTWREFRRDRIDNRSLHYSTGTSGNSHNASTSFPGICPFMATRSPRYHCLDTFQGVYLLQHENVHMVSPAFAKRFQRFNETEEKYVERLRQELEDKFLELGPDTVIRCK